MDKIRFFEFLGSPELELFLYGWSTSGADAGNALGTLLRTPSPSGLGAENAHGFTDPELDALIDAADDAPSLARRRKLLADALARVADLRPILPLVVQHESVALAAGVEWMPPVDLSLRLTGARPARPPSASPRATRRARPQGRSMRWSRVSFTYRPPTTSVMRHTAIG
jgi:ABC-type transport system substrate-binding protein